jgi:ketosteroid isomerase-like protein/uncharacterized membrane protein
LYGESTLIEIIPNWHPIWVHFAIALLITGTGVYLLLGWRGSKSGPPLNALIVARWMLWLGAAASLAALLTGYLASISVAHDDLAHANMMVHRNWAFASTSIFVVAAILEYIRRNQVRASYLSALILVAGSFTLVMTGLEGAENVYEHGLGVQRLPVSSTHDHDHEKLAEAPGPAAVESNDGHSHSHEDSVPALQPKAAISDANHPASQVAASFSRAIGEGDVEHIKSLMASDVLIFESGNVESSLAEYESHHMQSDIAFMSTMKSEVISRSVIDAGDMATVVTRSRIHGVYKDKEIELTNTETLVLKNQDDGWKIVHIHWSSS